MNRIKKEAVFYEVCGRRKGNDADQAYRRAYPPQACKNRVKRMAMERSSRKACNLKQPKEKRKRSPFSALFDPVSMEGSVVSLA